MNWSLVLLALAYGIAETAYFGWNWAPQSDAEMIADGVALLLLVMAVK